MTNLDKGIRFLTFALAGVALFAQPASAAMDARRIYSEIQDSIFTVEVHTGSKDSKSVLGSGYLVSSDGKIATNYHVVSHFLRDPKHYQIRVQNRTVNTEAKLIHFDLANDLAILQADIADPSPIALAEEEKLQIGKPIVSLGNPHGLRLSIIEGIFNGYAEKGLIDRMFISMPLNSGMSGGPILDLDRKVIGTNVSIIWGSNSISFGVPISKLHSLLKKPALKKDKDVYRQETTSQLMDLESTTMKRLSASSETKSPQVTVGQAQVLAAADLFNCWDQAKDYPEKGLIMASYSCSLKFTPVLGGAGEVGLAAFHIEYIETTKNRFSLYGYLQEHGTAHFDAPRFSSDGPYTKMDCLTEKIKSNSIVWNVNICVDAYVEHPQIHNYSVAATAVSERDRALHLTAQMKGFRAQSFQNFFDDLMKSIHWKKGAD